MQADTKLTAVNVRPWRPGLDWISNRLELKGFWAIADQGVVSLGNFLTAIILARSLSPEVYGVWTVTFGLILFLNVAHSSLVTYPLSVRSATHHEDNTREIVIAGLGLTMTLAVPLALILFGVCFLVGGISLGLCAGLALLMWQLQETTRRALMARLVFRKALLSDAIAFLGQATVLWWLARAGALSPERAFLVIALMCGVAAIIQMWLLRLRFSPGIHLREWARVFWTTGHWVFWSSLVTNFSIQAVPWALFLFRGPAEAAGFQAISNLLGVSHPIMLSLGNIIVPAAARANARNGFRAARSLAIKHALQGALLLVPYFAGLLLFPRQFLALLYGAGSPYGGLDQALRFLTLAYALHYSALALKFLLNALEKNRPQFVAELSGAFLLAVVVVPLVLWYGLAGAIVATGAWLAIRLTGNAIVLGQAPAKETA